MAGSEGSNATWKAVTTLEWKRKQKQPVAASKGVGAILGEAADVVVGKHGSAGEANNSPYLGRLSEIQVQDEAYIHQQLIKPEEVKPKRQPYRLLLRRASKSGRGLRVSISRKVRFNDADGSPTHKAATAAGPTATRAAQAPAAGSLVTHGYAVVGSAVTRVGMLSHPVTRTSSDPSAAVAVAATAGRRAGGVSFASQAGEAGAGQHRSSADTTRTGQQSSTSTEAAAGLTSITKDASTAAVPSAYQPAHSSASASTAAASAEAGKGHQLPPIQRSPSPAPSQHTDSQQRQQRRSSTSSSVEGPRTHLHATGSTAAGSSSSMGGQHSAPRVSSGSRSSSHGETSSSSSSPAHAVLHDTAPIMARFLQQPYGAEPPVGGSLELPGPQLAERTSSTAAAAAAGQYLGRRTTDLVDKQLQRLRGSTTVSNSNAQQAAQAGHSSTSSSSSAPDGSAGGSTDVTLKLGYRPTAIPQELFERWSALGSGATSAAAAPAAPVEAITSAAAAAATAAGPTGKQHEGRSPTPNRRLSATNMLEGRGVSTSVVGQAGQHPVHTRRRSTDSLTAHAATQQHAPGSNKAGRAGSGAPAAPQPAHTSSAPLSRRSSGVLQPTSRAAQQSSASSPRQQQHG